MSGGIELRQRYELAAAVCRDLRVLELGEVPAAVRAPLERSAGELRTARDDGVASATFDVLVALDGLREPDRRERAVAEVERLARTGARALVAFERDGAPGAQPGETPASAAQALAGRLGGALVLRQFLAEGALISGPSGSPEQAVTLKLLDGDAPDEDAAALIVVAGFEQEQLASALAHVRLTAAPVMRTYVRSLETAHAELLRANRELMRERIGRGGSAAVSLLNAQRELNEMKEIARGHAEQVRRIEAWYDAPRYHLADRIRDFMTKVPGLTGGVRLLWSLISTRAETPRLDAAAHPEDEELRDAAELTRAREGLAEEEEPAHAQSRLEE